MPALTDLYPALKPRSAEELAALSPDDAAKLLGDINKAGQAINTQVVQLDTQMGSLTDQMTEIEAQAKSEFGVSSLADLEALQADAVRDVTATYAKISAITLDAA